MPKYRLLQGLHIGLGKHPTKKGQMVQQTFNARDPKSNVIETDEELDKMFANKFKRIDGPTEPPEDYDPTFDKDDVTDNPLKAAKDAKDRKVKASAIPRSKEPSKELEDVDPDDTEEDTNEEGEGDEGDQGDEDEGEGGDEGDEKEGAFGQEVTEEFPVAEEAKLRVFKNDDGYTVTSEDDEETCLHEEELKSPAKVKEFVKARQEEAKAAKAKAKAAKGRGKK
jgi:hypothetical protein